MSRHKSVVRAQFTCFISCSFSECYVLPIVTVTALMTVNQK